MIKLLYFNAERNFGDELNVLIAKKMFCIDVVPEGGKKADAIFIGSLLQSLTVNKNPRFWKNLFRIFKKKKRPINVWGSGFISAPAGREYLPRPLNVYAVRGKYSLDRLKKLTHKSLDNAVLGDPGLLASRFIPQQSKKYDVGIIPHYVDKKNPALKNIKLKGLSHKIIDVQQDPETVIKQISECGFILSSSLHGLIIADSYGIPNQWIELSDMVLGSGYKFADYYSAFGLSGINQVDLRITQIVDADIKKWTKAYPVKQNVVQKLCDGLQKAFPYKVKFTLPLHLIQNIRFLTAVAEQFPNVVVDKESKQIIDHLNKYFKYNIETVDKNSVNVFDIKNISFEHKTPVVRFGDRAWPLVFSKQMLDFCQNVVGKNGITFSGFKTKMRVSCLERWIKNILKNDFEFDGDKKKFSIKNPVDVEITFSNNGRDWPEKSWDNEYYLELKKSEFVLCPNGDFIWTYRFFESIMCNAIPIVEDVCDLYDGFYFYDMKTPLSRLKYNKKWAQHNLKLFIERYMF